MSRGPLGSERDDLRVQPVDLEHVPGILELPRRACPSSAELASRSVGLGFPGNAAPLL